MPKGDNKTVLNCTTELKQFMDGKKGNLERSFHVALTYLEHHKDEFTAMYGQECYEAHVKRYSIPAVELRNRHIQRQKEINAEKRRELDIREKELAVKANFMNAETQAMQDKHETKEEYERKKRIRQQGGNWKTLDEIKAEQQQAPHPNREPESIHKSGKLRR